MLGRGVLLAAALAVCGSQAAALPVRVALDWPSGRPASALARARIQAVRTAGPTEGGVPVEAEAGPDGVVLDLGDGVWQVQASAPGYWSQGAEVAVGREAPAGVRLALWPAAALHGEVADGRRRRAATRPRGPAERRPRSRDPAPRGVRARSRARHARSCAAGSTREPGAARVRPACSTCSWRPPGYAPRYAWDVRLEAAASTDLGRTDAAPSGVGLRACGSKGRFEPGGSLSRDPAGGRDAARLAGARSGERARRRGGLLGVPQPAGLLPRRRRAARRARAGRRVSGGERRPGAARAGGRRDPRSILRCCSKS